MKEIQILIDHIDDELDDACTYAKLALEYKESDPNVADTFSRLSGEEMNHMSLLHKQVASKIEAYKRSNGDPPAAMAAVYDHLHQRYIDKAEKVAALQALYKK